MAIAALKAARMNQPGPPDTTGPGLLPTFPGLACGAGATGDLSGSGLAGADTVGAEVADGDGAEATGPGYGLTCPGWPP